MQKGDKMSIKNERREMKIRNRYKFKVTYRALPKKIGKVNKERQIDKKIEKDIKGLASLYGYTRFIGAGYNFLTKCRDIEMEFIFPKE